MKKRVVMTIAGIMGGTFTSSAVALAQTKTSVEERGPVQESTISIPDSEILAEEKEVAATIESTTTTSTIKTTSDSLEKALEATTSETSSTESGSASQSSASQHRKEIETEETSLKAQTTSTVLTGMIGTSQWSLDPTSGELTIGPGVFSDDVSSAFDSISNVKKVTFSGPVKAGKSLKSLFSSWFALLSIERLDYLDTSQVTDMSYMFTNCTGLQTLDVSNFDTSQVTNMSMMFYNCRGLQTLDVSNFETSQVTDMSYMFDACSGLQTLDVTKFNTSQVTYMWNMFSGCSGLQTLDLSNFDTSQVTNTDEMFDNCDALKKITLGAKSIFGTKTNTNLPSIADTSLYTGRWIGVNTSNTYSDSNTFMSNYDGSVPDTYVWEKASVLNSTLEPSSVRVHSESEVEWTWKITNSSSKSAENVYSDITLPEGLKIDKNSVKKNNLPVSVDDINGMNNLGTLSSNETVTFTFKTIVSGKPDKWLELMGKVTWEDNGIRTVNSSNKVKIIDEEQKDKGNQTNDLELLSVPVGFRYGILNKSNTPQTIHLNARNYQTHTNVVTDGFYTRLRDDRTKDNGWKLTAQLSDFSDETNSTVLTNSGIALKMENMKIESIKNRDTPQESIDQNPTGTPSTVSTNETLISGQAAKTLINAQANEGHGTWQLRIPFDKVSLTVPANTGEINKNYTATLTWSLDDTP
ncbi:BspA family leucine-rich repeat surface protein [Enterococcus faecalis]|uniref:BspA family leucine-rich repeat surface protein n=1 Tax=Enterococcus faecalis TaxID=1351 RepID=UPI0027E0EDB0|nr:BspA family leucine-rich repeat surface protein [Enterococcus faecalis]MDQ6353249.1 BspA family leucine-rich repeat surface protein [Enterococcus faecalis]